MLYRMGYKKDLGLPPDIGQNTIYTIYSTDIF